MEDRFIVLVRKGNFADTFYEVYDHDEVLSLVEDVKQDKDVEHIEVITLNTYDTSSWRWSNPNSNPE